MTVRLLAELDSYLTAVDGFLAEWFGHSPASYVVAFLILLGSAFLAKVVNFVFTQLLLRRNARASSEEDNHIAAILNAPIFYSVMLFGLYQSLFYMQFLGGSAALIAILCKSLVVLVWTNALSQLVRLAIVHTSARVNAGARAKAQAGILPLFKNTAGLVVWFAGATVLLKLWNLNLTPLLASAGIAGLAVALAAQETVSHIIGGLSIYLDKPFQVGDRIQLDSGEVGDVLDVGVRSTRIKTMDETVVIIPNSTVASSKIINYNKPKSKIKVKIELGLAYGTNVPKAKKAILETVLGTEGVEKEPAPSVYLTEMGDFALKFLVVAWANSPKQQFDVKTRLTERLYERLTKDKFVIPYPTQEVLVRRSK